jgi:hypothetical protein
VFVENDFNAISCPFDLSAIGCVRDVEIVRCSDFWDGPISGVARYGGSACWFQVYFADDLHGWQHVPAPVADQLRQWLARHGAGGEYVRVFLLHRLTDEQLREEQRWDELFQQHVGGRADASQAMGAPARDPAIFYERYQRERPTLDLARAPVLGTAWLLA